MSAAVEQKAARYLAEGRLTVRSRAGQVVEATCVGSAAYELGHEPEIGWYCGCPAHGLCAHLIALKLVTTGRRPGDRREP